MTKRKQTDVARLLAPRKGGSPVAAYKPSPADPRRLSQQAQAIRLSRMLLSP